MSRRLALVLKQSHCPLPPAVQQCTDGFTQLTAHAAVYRRFVTAHCPLQCGSDLKDCPCLLHAFALIPTLSEVLNFGVCASLPRCRVQSARRLPQCIDALQGAVGSRTAHGTATLQEAVGHEDPSVRCRTAGGSGQCVSFCVLLHCRAVGSRDPAVHCLTEGDSGTFACIVPGVHSFGSNILPTVQTYEKLSPLCQVCMSVFPIRLCGCHNR